MLDIQKALDTVDHSILCQKLEVLGVSSLSWFKSYLSDKKQYVCVSGAMFPVSMRILLKFLPTKHPITIPLFARDTTSTS